MGEKAKIHWFYLTIIFLLLIAVTIAVAHNFEAEAYVQCNGNSIDKIFPIEDGEEYYSGVIKWTSYIRNKAELYEPSLNTYVAEDMGSKVTKVNYSHVGFESGKCSIDTISRWEYR